MTMLLDNAWERNCMIKDIFALFVPTPKATLFVHVPQTQAYVLPVGSVRKVAQHCICSLLEPIEVRLALVSRLGAAIEHCSTWHNFEVSC
jgi:hypothetical protein